MEHANTQYKGADNTKFGQCFNHNSVPLPPSFAVFFIRRETVQRYTSCIMSTDDANTTWAASNTRWHVVKRGLDWTGKTRTESVICKTWTESVICKTWTQSVICTKIRQKPRFFITMVHWAKIFNTSELGNRAVYCSSRYLMNLDCKSFHLGYKGFIV